MGNAFDRLFAEQLVYLRTFEFDGCTRKYRQCEADKQYAMHFYRHRSAFYKSILQKEDEHTEAIRRGLDRLLAGQRAAIDLALAATGHGTAGGVQAVLASLTRLYFAAAMCISSYGAVVAAQPVDHLEPVTLGALRAVLERIQARFDATPFHNHLDIALFLESFVFDKKVFKALFF